MKFSVRPVPGHDGYFADVEGNIYSCWVNKGRSGMHKTDKLRKLSGGTQKTGHKHVYFKGGGFWRVHRVIYETFVGEIPNGYVVRHLNDIPYDNRLLNLQIGTQKDNMQDSKRNNSFPIGSRHGRSKLTEKDVLEIRKLSMELSIKEIAQRYNISIRNMRDVVNKKTWKHVD